MKMHIEGLGTDGLSKSLVALVVLAALGVGVCIGVLAAVAVFAVKLGMLGG